MPDDENGPQTPDLGADEWDESKCCRKDNGQFGSGSGENKKPDNKAQGQKTLKEFLGKEYTGVKGLAAVEKLLKEKRGHVKGAFTRQDIGDIDLVWGDEEKGLAHLIKRRTEDGNYPAQEVLNNLTDIIEKGTLSKNKAGRYEIWHKKFIASISPDYDGENIRWVITGFKQDKPKINAL